MLYSRHYSGSQHSPLQVSGFVLAPGSLKTEDISIVPIRCLDFERIYKDAGVLASWPERRAGRTDDPTTIPIFELCRSRVSAFAYGLQFGWNLLVIGGLEIYALGACAIAMWASPIYFTSIRIGGCDRRVRVEPVEQTFGEDWGEGYGYSVAREEGRIVYRIHLLSGLCVEPATRDYAEAYERLFPIG